MRTAPTHARGVWGAAIDGIPRPTGEVEALCREQNGTDHHVRIHW